MDYCNTSFVLPIAANLSEYAYPFLSIKLNKQVDGFISVPFYNREEKCFIFFVCLYFVLHTVVL